jgi:hypothetical protein
MFGTKHSGAVGCEICLEHSILELQGPGYVWNITFWSYRALHMFGTNHSGVPNRSRWLDRSILELSGVIWLEQRILQLQGSRYVWNKAFWSSRALNNMFGTKHSGVTSRWRSMAVNMIGTKHSGIPSRSIWLERSILELSGVEDVWSEAFCSFGTKHSGVTSRSICLERSILELWGVEYVWERSFLQL